MTTPTSDRTGDNESGEQGGGEAEFTPQSWAWMNVYGVYFLVQGEPPSAYHLAIYAVGAEFSDQPMRLLKPDHPIAELIASAPTLHTELHRLRAVVKSAIKAIDDCEAECEARIQKHVYYCDPMPEQMDRLRDELKAALEESEGKA